MPDSVYDIKLAASSYLRQCLSSGFNENIQLEAGRFSGGVVPQEHYIIAGDPRGDVTTNDIAGFYGFFGTTHSQIADGTVVTIPYQKRLNGSTYAGSSAHFTITAGSSSCPVSFVPKSIEARQGAAAVASGELIFLSSNGMVNPISMSVSQSLAAQAYVGQFSLGPVYVNVGGGLVLLPKGVGFTINFGVTVTEIRKYNGGIYGQEVFTEMLDPTIELTYEDFDALDTYLGGVAITACTAFLRKRASGSTYDADAATSHIKASFGAGIISSQAVSASETKVGQAGFRLTGRALTIATGQAIA